MDPNEMLLNPLLSVDYEMMLINQTLLELR